MFLREIANVKFACIRVMAALGLMATPLVAQSQQPYPAKPIRVVIGFSAGSELDVIGRLVTQKMGEGLGQQFIVENRTGAGGTLAAAFVAAAAPDGYVWSEKGVKRVWRS